MVAVLNASTQEPTWAQFCGGAVIGPRRVLTAAHCVVDRSSSSVEVLVGQTRLSESGGRRIAVRAISVAPGFIDGMHRNADAAVLTLAADAGVPALALAGEVPALPATAWTMGWGALNARASRGGNWYYADRLHELAVPVQSDDACENAYGVGFREFPYTPAWLLCAGTGDGRSGTCWGDSGAPLVLSAPTGWVDVGILNGGDACAAPGYFDFYVRADQIRAFALGAPLARQPDSVTRPRVTGKIETGGVVRCLVGRWRGSDVRYTVRWTRLGDRAHRTIARGLRYRLTARAARAGVRCTVTAVSRGGRNTAASPPARGTT